MSFENIGTPVSPDSYDMKEEKSSKDISGEEIENISDENAEKDIYDSVENSFKETENNSELDKFGFVQVLQDYFNKVSDDKKEELFKNINKFLAEYRKILDNTKDEEAALKKSNKAFRRIIGEEIGIYNAETGKISSDLHKSGFVKVEDKKAPIDADRVEYDRNGRPVDFTKKYKSKVKKADRETKPVESEVEIS
jgi:hypothetical protein